MDRRFEGGKPIEKKDIVVDREKSCPLLLRVFYKFGDHHAPNDFSMHGKEPSEEIQIYTWKNATLHELTELVRGVIPETQRGPFRMDFAIVYPDANGRAMMENIGTTDSQKTDTNDENKCLAETIFTSGDFLDIAIHFPPRERGFDREPRGRDGPASRRQQDFSDRPPFSSSRRPPEDRFGRGDFGGRRAGGFDRDAPDAWRDGNRPSFNSDHNSNNDNNWGGPDRARPMDSSRSREPDRYHRRQF